MGGAYRIQVARFRASPSRVSKGVSGENGDGKLTNRANWRGPAFEGRPAHKSPDSGPTQQSAISGDAAGGIRKSGFRDLARAPYWGGLLDSGGAFSGVSVAVS